jgi:hypothetical protein
VSVRVALTDPRGDRPHWNQRTTRGQPLSSHGTAPLSRME